MINCLLCDQPISTKESFSNIFSFSKSQARTCQVCKAQFEKVGQKHCPSCYKYDEDKECEDCLHWRKQGLPADHLALFQYNQAMASYFSRYKFFGDYALRKVFASELKLMGKEWKDWQLVPIPLSQKSLEERGFNQVEALLEEAGLSYYNLLEKKETVKQSSLSRKERLETQQPFCLISEKVPAEKILLIDDIYTTGQTIQHARKILLKAGAKTVKSFSIAR